MTRALQEASRAHEAASRRRVLVADDDADSAALMGYLLGSLGYEPVHATNGAEALELARETEPDLILMDLDMPAMSGFEAAAMIRRDLSLTKTRIVAVTAYDTPGAREDVMQSGFDGYVSKPVPVRLFGALIAGFLAAGA